MKNRFRFLGAAAVLAVAAGTTACDDWLEVANPTVIDAATVDPVQDAPTFAQSAMNNLFDAFDDVIVYGGWFSGEIWEGDSFPTRTDIGRRNIDFSEGQGSMNTSLNPDVYAPLATTIATGERIQEILADAEDFSSNINVARGAFASGYGILFQAETFCQVVISSGVNNIGSPLTSLEGAAESLTRFQRVIDVAGASDHPTAGDLVNAARVGLARAHLFLGNHAEAAAAAAQVPADFELLAPKVDDPSNRAALGNTVYSFTLQRPAIVVPPYFRALNDDRVGFDIGPSEAFADPPPLAQDAYLEFYYQTKYVDWGDDIRLASGLEARYIAAEAQLKAGDATAANALIAERSAAGGPDAVFNPSGDTLRDLLDQKARDFFLEGTHLGDWRRNLEAAPYVPAAGSAYYNPSEGGVFGTQTCMPLPSQEVLNNPNF